MTIRDTEGRLTEARKRLFSSLGVVEIQGVLMNAAWEPTACIEAIDYPAGEPMRPVSDLGSEASGRKVAFARQLRVPFYVVTSANENRLEELTFTVFELRLRDGSTVASTREKGLSPEQFAAFWANLKGTTQTKGLPDAGVRIEHSNVDQVLGKAGLAWGGNVDGVLLDSSEKGGALIEVRKTTKSPLDEYDPADYFHCRGGDYNTWKPLFRIAHHLAIPLVLLTFKRGEDRCGFARLRALSKQDGIAYHRGPPFEKLLSHQQAKRALTTL